MVRRYIFIILILLIIIPSISISAEDDYSIPEEYEDILDSIPEDIADLLPKDIFSNNANNIIEGAQSVTNWHFIFDFIFDTLGFNIKEIAKNLALILSLLILCSLLNMLRNTLKSKDIDDVVNLVGCIAVVSLLMEISKAPLSNAMNFLENLKLFVNSISPCITAMYAMGGNVTSAVVHNYGLIVFLSIMENICIVSLEIISGVCMALTLASIFVKENRLLALSRGIKNAFSFFLGFVMVAFTAVISTQSLLASKADNLSSKTAKMIAAQIIPLAGGTVGESLRTASASIEYLRSNVGVVLIIILILMIVPPIISIFLYRLVFIFSHSIAGVLGAEREGTIILEISNLYGYILAILSISSIILLFLITVFAKCASPLS